MQNVNKLKLNKKGISTTVESAGMFLVVTMMLALVLQVSALALTQITVKEAAYESARGGAKVGRVKAYSRAQTIAQQYGSGVLTYWNPNIYIKVSEEITVTIEQKIPVISKLFPQATVKSKSIEVIEEIA